MGQKRWIFSKSLTQIAHYYNYFNVTSFKKSWTVSKVSKKFAGSLKEPSGRMRMRNKYDQRHTCNAREVVVYLRYTLNFRIANRVAITTNLCNYDL